MSVIRTILAAQFRDAVRSRWMVLNGLLYLILTEGLMLASGTPDRVLVSLINVVLLLVPLVAVMFGTMHFYNAREFILLLLTQPVKRSTLFAGLFAGLAGPLAATFAAGVALPFIWHGMLGAGHVAELLALVGLGCFLTCIFVALALTVATVFTERLQGVGVALLVWIVAAIAYDGLVLVVVTVMSSFPVEKPLLVLMLLNPVDLARVLLLMLFDAGALMGYTGAVFMRFFGSATGVSIALLALGAWMIGPLLLARRVFTANDF